MISIVIQSQNSVTVTRSHGVIARLFLGRQESTREAFDGGIGQWIYTDDNRFVEDRVDDEIERAFTRRAAERRLIDLVRR